MNSILNVDPLWGFGMQNHTDTSPGHDPPPDDAVEADVLIGRIIDLEATGEDQQRFEQLAAADPSLWRALATRQRDMAVLAERVSQETTGANRVELPVLSPRRRVPWALAYAGWAAVLVIAAVWAILPGQEPVPLGVQTADEHFELYRQAPFVQAELDPILLDWEPIDDEWIRIFIMRRVEEAIVTRRPLEELRGENDKLTVSPAELRKDSPPLPIPDDQ
ncbi:MAG: hypothetical protein V3T84_16625 [Phycisphaerales bacterium]